MDDVISNVRQHKLSHPVITSSLIAGVALNLIVGTSYFVRLEGATEINASEIQHTKELHEQDNDNIREQLDDIGDDQDEIREDQKEIKRLLIESLNT